MRHLLFSLALLLHAGSVAFSQNYNTPAGWVVTTSGDTLRGTIQDRSAMNERVFFRPEKNTDYREYTPAEIRAFYYEGGFYYKAVPVPGGDDKPVPTFLWCLEEGNLTLYRYKDYFYAEKPAGVLTKLERRDKTEGKHLREDRKYAGILKYLTADCPSIQGKIEKVLLDAGDLAKIVSEYNTCGNPSARPASKPRPSSRFRVEIGARAGVVAGHLEFFDKRDIYDQLAFEGSIGYTAGLLINFPLVGHIFSVQPELMITHRSGTYAGQLNFTTQGRLEVDMTHIQLPIMLYYAFGEKIRPFVAAGGIIGYAVQRKAHRMYPFGEGDLELQGDEAGFRIGTGVGYRWSPHRQVALEYSFERTETLFSNDNFGALSHYITLRTSF